MPILEMRSTRRGRLAVFVRTQLPFALGVFLVVLVAAIGAPDRFVNPLISAGVAIVSMSTAAAILCPWERWGKRWMILIPTSGLLAVACLRTVLLPVLPSTGFLCIFPLVWLAYEYRRAGILISVLGTLVIAAFPALISATLPTTFLGWANIFALPTLAIGIAVIVNIASMFLRRANATVRAQKRDLQDSLRIAIEEQAVSRAILDTVDAGVAFYDANDQLAIANARADAMVSTVGFQLDTPPYAGHDAREADRKTLIPLDEQIIPRALRGESISDHLEWLGPEGDQIAIMSSCARVVDPEGNIVGTVIVGHDVTDLANAVSVREEFLATVSHELRTPLASILGYLELAQEDLSDDPDAARDYLDVIKRNADELLRRVSELLSLTSRELTISPQPSDVPALIRRSVERMRMMARPRGISIDVDLPSSLTATLDPGRIEQVLDNILQNAIKYSPDDTHITVKAETSDGVLTLTVVDQGIGMTPAEVRQATDKFFRADSARTNAIQGVGIGLSIVHSIIQAHRGTLLLTSTPGAGTTALVRLPSPAAG